MDNYLRAIEALQVAATIWWDLYAQNETDPTRLGRAFLLKKAIGKTTELHRFFISAHVGRESPDDDFELLCHWFCLQYGENFYPDPWGLEVQLHTHLDIIQGKPPTNYRKRKPHGAATAEG